MKAIQNKRKLAADMLVPLAGGMLVALLTRSDIQTKYEKLQTPAWSPPRGVFPAAWTSLYAMMGAANYRATEKNSEAAIPYQVQLALNWLWPLLFFKWNLRGAAFAEIAVLLGFIMWTAFEFWEADQTAGAMMIPYAAWTTFALGLNYSIWRMNKQGAR